MASFDPSVPENIRHLQRQINRNAVAPLGPVSIGPGEGHIRFFTGTGDTFQVGPSGAQVKFRGSLTGLTPHLEANATKNEAQDGRLDGHDSALASHGTRLGNAEGRLDGHDSTLSSHSTRINTAQGRADSAHANAATAQSRADSAYTRAGTGISNAATAQSRADSAYSRATDALNAANGAATPGQIAALNNKIDLLADRVRVLEEWRASLPGN